MEPMPVEIKMELALPQREPWLRLSPRLEAREHALQVKETPLGVPRNLCPRHRLTLVDEPQSRERSRWVKPPSPVDVPLQPQRAYPER